MARPSEWLLWESIRRQLAFDRYSQGVAYRMVATLNRMDASIFGELSDKLAYLDAGTFTMQRLEMQLSMVRSMIADAMRQTADAAETEFRAFVAYEAEYQREMLTTATSEMLPIASLHPEQVYTAAMARPFQGLLLRGALDDLGAARARKVRQTIANGYATGETTQSIITKLRGTRAKGYADGLFQSDRRHVETITRTALSHMAQFTRQRQVEANVDLVKAISWTATLDSRTSAICSQRDGKLYTPVTHKPIGHELPWMGGPGAAHFNCRSHETMVLKSNKELGIDLPEIGDEGRTRASANGQVDAKVTYEQWLKDQPESVQVEVLGKTRARLFRDGMGFDKLYSAKGDTLTLKQLETLDRKALQAA